MQSRQIISIMIALGFTYLEMNRKSVKIEATKWYLKPFDKFFMKFAGNMILGLLIAKGLLKITLKLKLIIIYFIYSLTFTIIQSKAG